MTPLKLCGMHAHAIWLLIYSTVSDNNAKMFFFIILNEYHKLNLFDKSLRNYQDNDANSSCPVSMWGFIRGRKLKLVIPFLFWGEWYEIKEAYFSKQVKYKLRTEFWALSRLLCTAATETSGKSISHFEWYLYQLVCSHHESLSRVKPVICLSDDSSVF